MPELHVWESFLLYAKYNSKGVVVGNDYNGREMMYPDPCLPSNLGGCMQSVD